MKNKLIIVILSLLGFIGHAHAWTITTLDSSFTTDELCLATNRSSGVRNIIFEASNAFYLLSDDGAGVWGARTEVENLADTRIDTYAGYPSCALDATGDVYLTYTWSQGIYHETSTISWTEADDLVDASSRNELSHVVVDSSGYSHVIFFDETNEELLYSTNAAGTWSAPETVATDTNTYASMAIDSAGKLHVAYHEETCGCLEYATLDTTSATAGWVADQVVFDDVKTVGQSNSIAVDSDDNVYISYAADLDNISPYFTIMLAKKSAASSVWTTETVDATETYSYAYGTSIAVDAAKLVHITYYDMRTPTLKYATNLSGGWVISNVESGEFFPSYISAADNGDVSIAYSDRTNDDLKFATYKANHAPAANAGADQNSRKPRVALFYPIVYLSGSGSDVDGDALTYKWTLTTKPATSARTSASIVNATSPTTAYFRPDKIGTYVLTLTVTDSSWATATATDTMSITASSL